MSDSKTPLVNSKKVTERIAARREAEQVIELCRDSTAVMGSDAQSAFWSIIRDHALTMAPLTKSTAVRTFEPMSDSESRLFEQRIMGFGQYRGMRVHETPLRYLDWLVGQKDTFKEDVARYLLNPGVMAELEKELATNK